MPTRLGPGSTIGAQLWTCPELPVELLAHIALQLRVAGRHGRVRLGGRAADEWLCHHLRKKAQWWWYHSRQAKVIQDILEQFRGDQPGALGVAAALDLT